jgi:hypothetical protein
MVTTAARIAKILFQFMSGLQIGGSPVMDTENVADETRVSDGVAVA